MKLYTFHKLFLIVIPFTTLCQEDKLSFDFSFSQQNWEMKTLNDYLIDTNNPEVNLFVNGPYLKGGVKFQGQFNYQPSKYINFGVYANYQTAQVSIERNFIVYDPIENTYTDVSYDFILQPKAKSLGVNLGVLHHELFNFNKKKAFFKRVTIRNEFKLGISNSQLRGQSVSKKPFSGLQPVIYGDAYHLAGDISLSIGYTFLKKPIFSSFGLIIGYQFYQTGIITNPLNEDIELSDGTSVILDFSGLYFGVNLLIGK